MLCPGMEVIANSLQDFGSWGRRVSHIRCYSFACDGDLPDIQLVTIRKVTTEQYPRPTFEPNLEASENDHVPAHKDFREKYFQGFKKDVDVRKTEP